MSGAQIAAPGADDSVAFLFPAERRVTEWPGRHANGEVPGRWPYGLDELTGFSSSPVGVHEVGPPALPHRLAHRLGVRVPRRRRRRALGMTWDENMAHRMVLSQRYDAMYSGVIWATDRPPGTADAHRVRRILSRLDGVWVLSEAQLEALDPLTSPSTTRAWVPFGIDEQFFGARGYPDRPLVLSLGGDRDRDPGTMVEAFRRVAEARPDAELVLQTTADVDPVPGLRVVRRLDHLELRELYARASVVAVAARHNLHVSGMTVSLESMATGRPVVVTGTPGMQAYVEDGVCGLHAAPGRSAEMADHVIDLLDSPREAAAMGRAGRERVERSFTSALMARRLADVVGLR